MYKNYVQYDQLGFITGIQGWLNIQKSINPNNVIKKLNKKNHIVISIDSDKMNRF